MYKNNDEKQYYYLNPISIWNNQHINAYPNITTSPLNQQSERKSYEAIEEGQTRKSTNEEINYNYGSTFIERSNIHPLLPYAGDIIIEGRWGNSIRFGSTVQSNNLIYNSDKKCRISTINFGLLDHPELPCLTHDEAASWVKYLVNLPKEIEVPEITVHNSANYREVQSDKEMLKDMEWLGIT